MDKEQFENEMKLEDRQAFGNNLAKIAHSLQERPHEVFRFIEEYLKFVGYSFDRIPSQRDLAKLLLLKVLRMEIAILIADMKVAEVKEAEEKTE